MMTNDDLFQVLGIYTDHGVDVTRDEVQRIFDAADKDGTGLLTEQEFVNSSKPGEVAGVSESGKWNKNNYLCIFLNNEDY